MKESNWVHTEQFNSAGDAIELTLLELVGLIPDTGPFPNR